MSPTKRSKSAIVNSPGVFDGSSGFQFLPLIHRYERVVAVNESDEHFRDDRRADRTEPLAVTTLLRLLQNVVPERRVLMQAVLLGDCAVGAPWRFRRASAD